MQITNALKGIGGQYELNRLVGAFGGVVFIVTVPAFVAYDMWRGREFDVTAYCLAFPGGIAGIVGAIAGAVAWKDAGVAKAKVIEQTGAIPVAPPAGPSVQPEDVK